MGELHTTPSRGLQGDGGQAGVGDPGPERGEADGGPRQEEGAGIHDKPARRRECSSSSSGAAAEDGLKADLEGDPTAATKLKPEAGSQ